VDNETFWLVFLFSALLLNISPGPDLLYILSRTISSGKKVGIASALGVCSGAFVHVVLAACGVSALIAASENAFDALKYAGAAYLLYLGVKSVMPSTGAVHDQDNRKSLCSFWRSCLSSFSRPWGLPRYRSFY
jgi:threonine/homoserine/homoserine lactone efflux protein